MATSTPDPVEPPAVVPSSPAIQRRLQALPGMPDPTPEVDDDNQGASDDTEDEDTPPSDPDAPPPGPQPRRAARKPTNGG